MTVNDRKIKEGIKSNSAAIRYWAVKAIGNRKLTDLKSEVKKLLTDKDASVRISAAESFAQFGEFKSASELLAKEITNPNLIAGMYAIRALEAIGQAARGFAKDDIKKAISENQVVIVAGETGSGKTTQLPKICMVPRLL